MDNFNKEIENLKRNPQSAKNSRRKCQELEVAVARLKEEKRLLTDQVDLAEKRCDLIFTENLMMTNEKNNSISELNKKIKELDNKNLRFKRWAEVFREKCTCLKTEIMKTDQELKDLRQRQSESDRVVEELKLANKTIEELKREKMESDRKAELLESMLEKSTTRLSKIDEMLTMKLRDIQTWVNDLGKFGTSEVGLNLDSEGLLVKKENSSRDVDAEVVVVDATLPANGNSDNGLSKNGAINSVKPRTGEGIENSYKGRTSPGKQSGHNPPQEENNEPKEPLGSGANVGGMQLLSSSNESSRSSPPAAAGNIIDSDGEIKADGVSSFALQPESIIEAVKPVTREAKKRVPEKLNETDVASKKKKKLSPKKNALPAEECVPPYKEKESDNDAFQLERPIQTPAPMKMRLRSVYDGTGTDMPRHVGGSCSTIRHREILSQELGQEVTSLDVIKHGTPTTKRAARLSTAVEDRRASTQEELNDDAIYANVVPKNKNNISGNGSFNKIMTGTSFSGSPSASCQAKNDAKLALQER